MVKIVIMILGLLNSKNKIYFINQIKNGMQRRNSIFTL